MDKNKKRPQKSRLPIPLIALIGGGVVLLLAVIFLMSGGQQNAGGTPVLSVDREKIEFGDVNLDTNLTFQIKVTNTGDGVLKFNETPTIQIVEGC